MQERRELAQTLKLEGYTYQEIGDTLGISRQRVQQIVSPPKEIRNRIVEQANHCCQECGVRVGSSGHVHHKGNTGLDDFNDIDNLILLCISCHRHVHPGVSMKVPLLKQVREAQLLIQEELAAKCHLSQSAISRIEAGMGVLPKTILALAAALGVEPSVLVEEPGVTPGS